MGGYERHEGSEHERPGPSARRIPARQAQDAYDQAPAPPHPEAGSQFTSIIRRQVAAERAAKGEPKPELLPTNMPAHLRQGPGSQTANAFYQEAARRQQAREAGQAPHDGAGEAHDHGPHVAHPVHAAHQSLTHPHPVEHHSLAHPSHPSVAHHAHAAVPHAASHQAAALAHGVDPELLAAVLAGLGALLDAPLQEAVERHLGVDLGAVRIHTGLEADLLSEQAGRMAFAVGESLIFGRGAYRPATPEGQRLLADGLAEALDHGHGMPQPLSRTTTVTGGGGGRHGEGVGAPTSFSAASLFAGTEATTGGQAATAGRLLPLIHQVYARQRRTGAHPHALVGNVLVADGHDLAPAHDGIADAYDVAPLSLYAGVRGDASGKPLNVHATPGGLAFTTLALCSVVYVDQKLTNKRLDQHALDRHTRDRYANDIWYRVALPGAAQGHGYVVGWGNPSDPAASSLPSYLDFRTPDPASTLYHCTTPGEGALGIVARHYRVSDDVRRLSGDAYADLRFYVNVLSYLNPRSVPSPDPGGLNTANWEQTRVMREDYIWVPSKTFADRLKGKVGSGSYTHGGWGRFSADMRANWNAAEAEAGEALDGLGALVALPVLGAGIVAGAARELWDTLTGLIEAPAAVVGLVQELFSGQLFGLLGSLWDELTHKGGVEALVGTLFGSLEREWNDADFFKRWFFRGTVIGGAVAFLALTFFSDGLVAALKGLSLTAKLADAIRGLDAAQGFVAAAKAARETAAGRAVWQAFTLRSLTGSLGARTLGLLLKQRMALQDIKALVDGIGPAAVKALVRQKVPGATIAGLMHSLGGPAVKALVAAKVTGADIAYLNARLGPALVTRLLGELTPAAVADVRFIFAQMAARHAMALLHDLTIAEARHIAGQLGRNGVKRLFDAGLSPRQIGDYVVTVVDKLSPSQVGKLGKALSATDATDLVAKLGTPVVQRLFADGVAPARMQALLHSLLSMTDDVPQMKRLLALVSDDAVKLEKFLKLAGGKGQAARLETLINLAVRKEADRVADLLNLPECRTVAEFERLADAVPLFKQTPVGTPPMPRNLTPPSMTGAQAFSGANMPHFLDEHTYEYYDFANISAQQSFWPAGTSAQDVAGALEETIDSLRRSHTIVHPGFPDTSTATSKGISVQFGVRGAPPYQIGQFFPLNGSGVETFVRAQLKAFRRIVVP